MEEKFGCTGCDYITSVEKKWNDKMFKGWKHRELL